MRIGHGYDVHKLISGRPLILGGVKIVHDKGLLGHSDADVLTHAIIDALVGATGLGDIGRHFPDTDQAFKNIDSMILLSNIGSLLNEHKYNIINIDSTVIAQKPKIKDYILKMEQNIAKALDIDIDKINVKATTEEGLGFTGQLAGIAAHAVALID